VSSYDINDLLELIARERAERLLIEVGRPPIIYLRKEDHVVEGPAVTRSNAAELLQGLASPEQFQEIDRCGDARFIFSLEDVGKFGVTAQCSGEQVRIEARNLSVSEP
jgi:Tfp pilus assembly ATPase PilU